MGSKPCDLACDPAQYTHIQVLQPGTPQQPSQTEHHVAGIFVVEESDRPQGCFQLCIHRLSLLDGRQDGNTRGLALEIA